MGSQCTPQYSVDNELQTLAISEVCSYTFRSRMPNHIKQNRVMCKPDDDVLCNYFSFSGTSQR